MKVFFHIGMYKTATTWFQRQLFPNIEGIRLIHTKHIDRISAALDQARSEAPVPTIVVSHEAFGGTISHHSKPGMARAKLESNLTRLAALAPNRAIIVGYREQRSWLQSAFAQRATKNFGLNSTSYLGAFSLEDLSWCDNLQTIAFSCSSVFPFLYEELLYSPEVLVEDLCRFLDKPSPPELDALLRARENPTPRSWVGQFTSRLMLMLANTSDQKRRQQIYGLGARLDAVFPARQVNLPSDLADSLTEDWNSLLSIVGERRGRNFSWLANVRNGVS
jgi:hypothetical protein